MPRLIPSALKRLWIGRLPSSDGSNGENLGVDGEVLLQLEAEVDARGALGASDAVHDVGHHGLRLPEVEGQFRGHGDVDRARRKRLRVEAAMVVSPFRFDGTGSFQSPYLREANGPHLGQDPSRRAASRPPR